MAWQSAIAIGAGVFLIATAKLPASTELIVPFVKTVAYPLGAIGFCVLTYFVIVGTSNAVNLTDGLDGLAALPTVLVAAGLSIFAYVAGHAVFSKYLGLPFIPGAHEVVVFCAAMCGAWAFVVQRLSGPSVHGRRRRAGAGRGAGHGGGDRASGNRALDHGRPVRDGSAVGDDPWLRSSSPASECSAWRRCTITMS